MKGSYRNIKFQSFCHRILTRHAEDYPEITRLCKIAMCISVSSVACERGFSLQSKIKVKARTSLTHEALDMLMKLATGPEIKTFPYELAMRHWNKEKKRRLATVDPTVAYYRCPVEGCDNTVMEHVIFISEDLTHEVKVLK